MTTMTAGYILCKKLITTALFTLRNAYREEKQANVDDVRAGTGNDAERTQQVKRLQRKSHLEWLPVSH